MQRLLSYTCKLGRNSSAQLGAARGFTLIELLVALVVASIMISTLLTFMVDILTKDRKEQAKTATEQEIQMALNYIARDLEQAVYIYDGEGLQAITGGYSTTTGTAATDNKLPAGSDRVPVLVFWKRTLLDADQDVKLSGGSTKSIGCLVGYKDLKGNKGDCNNQDYHVYSLVAYYLMKDATCNLSGPWSCAARIGRFEIRDGIRDEEQKSTTAVDGKRTENSKDVYYDLLPSKGFNPFTLDKEIELSMNEWTKHSDAYEDNVQILMDYVDQTTIADGAPAVVECPTVFGVKETDAEDRPQQVPNYTTFTEGTVTLDKVVPDAFKTGSFYACVDSNRTVAQVYIRGNALARTVANTQVASQAKYRSGVSAFFPTGSIQVKGRGLLNVEQQN